MTREETKELLTHMMMSYTPKDQYGDYDDPEPYEQAIDMAIEALRREEAEEKGWRHRIRPSNVEVVVRCKDCRWYENRYGEVCHNPRYGDGHANYSPPYVDEEYFCKDGERSE